MIRKIPLFTFLLLSISTSPAYSQSEDDPAKLGQHYFTTNDYEKSFEYFTEAFIKDPANLNVSFMLGRAAFMKGDYENALMAFDRVLIMDPDAIRVKLEVARCHLMLGAYETAKMHFYEVLDNNPPASVRKNIDVFLSAIAAKEKKHFITGMVSLDFSIDDNVRTSPTVDSLDLYDTTGSTIVLADIPIESAVKEEFFNSTLLASHIYKITDTDFSWKTTALGYNSFYTSYKDLDLMLVGLSSGPVYQGKSFLWEIYGLFNDINLAYDQYMRQVGGASTLSFALDPKMLISSMVGINKKKYAKDENTDKDATNYNIRISPMLIFGENRFTFSLGKERENADSAYNSYDSVKWSLRYDSPKIIFDTAIFTSLAVNLTDYDALKPSEPAVRSDHVQDLTIGLNKKLWTSKNKDKNISLQVKHTYTDSKSSVPTYTYRKNLTSSSMMFTF